MKIPQSQFLHSQSFRSDLCEFVWRFPESQLILQIHKNAFIYMEAGYLFDSVDVSGKEIPKLIITFSGDSNQHKLEDVLTDNNRWSVGSSPEVYNNFQNGKDLIPLVTDVLEFLK